jgi:hypothetical protein
MAQQPNPHLWGPGRIFVRKINSERIMTIFPYCTLLAGNVTVPNGQINLSATGRSESPLSVRNSNLRINDDQRPFLYVSIVPICSNFRLCNESKGPVFPPSLALFDQPVFRDAVHGHTGICERYNTPRFSIVNSFLQSIIERIIARRERVYSVFDRIEEKGSHWNGLSEA